jgi:hypothetical protein
MNVKLILVLQNGNVSRGNFGSVKELDPNGGMNNNKLKLSANIARMQKRKARGREDF